MDYPWYEKLNKETNILQGDLVPNCPILIPPSIINVGDEPEIEIKLIDSIILSQSCDLVNGKIEIVLVCPYYPLKHFIEQLSEDQKSSKGTRKAIDNLRRGFLPGYHLLNKFSEVELLNDYQVVDFKNVYGIQFHTLEKIIQDFKERIRLLSPYREHLSQAFARYFMRVGLPQDISVEGY